MAQKTNKKEFACNGLFATGRANPIFSTGMRAGADGYPADRWRWASGYASFGEWFATLVQELDQHSAQQRGRGHRRAGHDVCHHLRRHRSGRRFHDGGRSARCMMSLIDSGSYRPADAAWALPACRRTSSAIAVGDSARRAARRECTGVLIAHFGKLPPFIATLGMMKICRSVTQQCMQKASPTVPKAFLKIANARYRRRNHSADSLLAGAGG